MIKRMIKTDRERNKERDGKRVNTEVKESGRQREGERARETEREASSGRGGRGSGGRMGVFGFAPGHHHGSLPLEQTGRLTHSRWN